MKTTFNNLLCLAVAILVTGCASLDERLASTDMTVRNEAFGELLSAEKLNVEIAERSVQTISDSNRLEKLATSAKNPTVRLAALSRVQNQTTIVSVAQDDADVELRTAAVGRINDQMVLKDIVLNGTQYDQRQLAEITKRNWEWAMKMYEADRMKVQIAALRHLTDPETLLLFATNAPSSEVRSVAISRLSDEDQLAEIAQEESDESIRKNIYSRIISPEKIILLAKEEPNSQIALNLLTRLPNQRFYNELKGQLGEANKILEKARANPDDVSWQNSGESVASRINQQKFSFLSPWVTLSIEAELPSVRMVALSHIPSTRKYQLLWQSIAEKEVKRFLWYSGPTYKSRDFEWYDKFEPLGEETIGLFVDSRLAWPDDAIPSEVILHGLIVRKNSGYAIARKLLERSCDRKLLSYLAENSTLVLDDGVDPRGVFMARRIDERYNRQSWEPRFNIENPWGVIRGLCWVSGTGRSNFTSSSYHYFYPPQDICKARLAMLDRKEAEARAAREAEKESQRKAAHLASVQSETSQEALEKTARSEFDAELRVAAIKRLKNQSVLEDLAINDENNTIRAAAAIRLTSSATLMDILENDFDQSVRESAFRTILKRHPSAIDVSVITRLASDKKVSAKELARSVQSLEDSPEMRALVKNDLMDIAIRLAALSRISSQVFLDEIISDTNNEELCIAAVSRAKNPEVLLAAANRTGGNDDSAKAAIDRLQALGQWELLSTQSTMASVRQRAVTHVSDPSLLGKIATRDSAAEVRLVAIKRVSDPVLLKQLAEGDNDLRIALAALDKMTDESFLEAIALKSIHPKVRILAASKIHDSEMKNRVQDSLGPTIETMNTENLQQLSSIQNGLRV